MTSKELQTLRARAALIGVTLEPTTDDHERCAYALTKGAFTVIVYTREGIEAWLSQAAPLPHLEGADAS